MVAFVVAVLVLVLANVACIDLLAVGIVAKLVDIFTIACLHVGFGGGEPRGISTLALDEVDRLVDHGEIAFLIRARQNDELGGSDRLGIHDGSIRSGDENAGSSTDRICRKATDRGIRRARFKRGDAALLGEGNEVHAIVHFFGKAVNE